LQETLEQTVKRDVEKQLIDQLLESHDFEVPDSLVEQETDRMLRTMAETYLSQRVNIDELAINTPAQRELLKPTATRQVKAAFIINAIATQESIESNEEDVERELDRMAKGLGVTKDYIKDRMEEESPGSLLRSQIIQEKTYRFLEEHAEVIAPDEATEKEPSATAEEAT
jgi:trigger factor